MQMVYHGRLVQSWLGTQFSFILSNRVCYHGVLCCDVATIFKSIIALGYVIRNAIVITLPRNNSLLSSVRVYLGYILYWIRLC